jgi:hypothetical protein
MATAASWNRRAVRHEVRPMVIKALTRRLGLIATTPQIHAAAKKLLQSPSLIDKHIATEGR